MKKNTAEEKGGGEKGSPKKRRPAVGLIFIGPVAPFFVSVRGMIDGGLAEILARKIAVDLGTQGRLSRSELVSRDEKDISIDETDFRSPKQEGSSVAF